MMERISKQPRVPPRRGAKTESLIGHVSAPISARQRRIQAFQAGLGGLTPFRIPPSTLTSIRIP